MEDPGGIIRCLKEMAHHAVVPADGLQPLFARLEFMRVAFEFASAKRRDGQGMFAIGKASAARR